METSKERRMFERIPARFPTKYHNSSLDYGLDVFLKDVSASGACITTRERLYMNDVVSLDVKVPDGQVPVQLNGRICWAREVAAGVFKAGIEFHKINLLRVHRLTKYALEHSKN